MSSVELQRAEQGQKGQVLAEVATSDCVLTQSWAACS